jgi:multiple sugar transport system ATP-binding protein
LLHKQVIINGSSLSLQEAPEWPNVARVVKEDEDLILGIRPENITLFTDQAPMSFPGEMYVTQPLGAETLLSLQVGESIVSVRLFTDEPPQYKGRVWIQPDPRRIFLYRSNGDLLA